MNGAAGTTQTPTPGPGSASLPRRQRIAILVALGGVTAICWAYLIVMAVGMADMQMPAGGSMGAMDAMQMEMGITPWTAADWGLMLAMWVVMMIGMMVPSATPMALIYAAVARKAAGQGHALAPTAVFVAGYLLMWVLFSVAATVAQWALDQAALLSPMMVTTSPALGAGIVIVAGIFQLTPAKNACLAHCRAPAHFISKHWRDGAAGALRMGLHHGAYCLGCCWALMALLFFGGVMSLWWILGITVFVLLEKVMPFGAWGGRIVGVAMIVIGGVLMAFSIGG